MLELYDKLEVFRIQHSENPNLIIINKLFYNKMRSEWRDYMCIPFPKQLYYMDIPIIVIEDRKDFETAMLVIADNYQIKELIKRYK